MKDNSITIENFQRGVSDSPHLGFSTIQNLDVDTVPGVARINFMATNVTNTTGTPYWFAYDEQNQVMYTLTESGVIYSATTPFTSWSVVSGNTTGDANNGLVVWHNALFAFRAGAVDVLFPLNGAATWTNNWASYTASGIKPTLNGQDDILYIGSGNKIMSLMTTVGNTFTPATPATYSFNTNALDLPLHYTINCLAELGEKLMIGAYKGVVPYSGSKEAKIFPWDRSDDTFTLPITVNEFGITKMVTKDNVLYFMAGTTGALYATNGSSVSLLRELYKPLQVLSTQQDIYGYITIDATANPFAHSMIIHKGKIFFGVSGAQSYTGGQGVWSYDIATGSLKLENQISTGNSTSAGSIHINCLASVGQEEYLIGWTDGNTSTQGVDRVGTSRYTSYAGFLDSQLIPVGHSLQPRTFSNLVVELAKPLKTGQGVKISYRKNLFDNFTTLATFDFDTYEDEYSFVAAAPITDADFIQIRAALTTTASSPSSPELRMIILQ